MALVWVALGGAFGASLRYLCSLWIKVYWMQHVSIATLCINLIGSFCMGLLWSFAGLKATPEAFKLFVWVGFLGGFTTFSAFSLENLIFIKSGNYKIALFNIVLSNVLGVFLVLFGAYCGQRLGSSSFSEFF